MDSTDLKTVIIENTWLDRQHMDIGWGNGYVLLPIGHPWHGVHYDKIDVDVHYGLTFSGLVGTFEVERFEAITDADLGKWMIGFDTAHYRDSLERWPKEAVQAEADRLLQQIQDRWPVVENQANSTESTEP